jgi:hypothetical protein
MTRHDNWQQQEIRDAIRQEGWTLNGPRRVVKVVPLDKPLVGALKGFVCLEKVLLGKTPSVMEALLGLPARMLERGCRVYRFKRLPMASEVEYELTALYPGGLAFNAVMHDPAYPRGSNAIHQWRLLIDVPVEHLLDILPNARYPYLHG